MESVREQLQLFVRRFGLLDAASCDKCCGGQVSMAQGHILFEIRRASSPFCTFLTPFKRETVVRSV